MHSLVVSTFLHRYKLECFSSPVLCFIYLYSRVNILQFLQQPLVLPVQHLLVSQQRVPDSEQFAVLGSQSRVFFHVQLYQLHQFRSWELVQLVWFYLGWSSAMTCGKGRNVVNIMLDTLKEVDSKC